MAGDKKLWSSYLLGQNGNGGGQTLCGHVGSRSADIFYCHLPQRRNLALFLMIPVCSGLFIFSCFIA